jgi:hypothetical protein
MTGERPPYGQLVSAFGAVVLAVAVFLPWYGVSFTANGLSYAQQVGSQVASQYGNATLQSYMSSLHTSLAGYVGHEFLSLSAHQALKTLNVVLLIVAGVGCVVALFALAGSASAQANRGALALLGAVAAACVLYRMISPPNPAGELLSMSLREGAWLALIGSLAMVAGAAWPARTSGAGAREKDVEDAWSGLSGWTPEA